MIIGIDAHNLEGGRTGVGRVLVNLLRQWDKFSLSSGLRFILYFKREIPVDLGLVKPNFQCRLLAPLFGRQSHALFKHFLLWRAAKKDKVDVLFCPDYTAPIFYRGKTGLILHDISYEARPDIFNWPSVWDKILLKKFSRISTRRASAIFTVSEFSKQEVLKYYRVDKDKVFVFLNGIEERFRKIEDRALIEDFKKRYRIKDKLVCFVGSIVNRRHLDKVIAAFAKVGQDMPQYQFFISGRNHTSPFVDIEGQIKELNKKLGREAILRIDFISDDDLPLLYNACDWTIYLSEYEGFGLPVLESMACGTPVITSPVTSIPEVAGDAAIYVKDSNGIEEIERVLRQGLADERLREELIAKGLARQKMFSWEKSARIILDALVGLK